MSEDRLINGRPISAVSMDRGALLSTAQKHPGGFICNVHLDNLDLMLATAKELGYEIEEREPRNADPKRLVGIYADVTKTDPKKLLALFFQKVVQRAQTRHSTEGVKDASSTTRKPVRRSTKVRSAQKRR